MNIDPSVPPSPGLLDCKMTQLTTSGKDLADSKKANSHELNPLGHQGGKTTGGMNKYLRVLCCTGLDDSINYKILYEELKSFGDIERIKLVYKESDYDGYVTFSNHSDALAAQEALDNGKLNFSGRSKLISDLNVADEECDFVPSICYKPDLIQTTRRVPPLPFWHVVSYKPGRENRYRAAQEVQAQVGIIPKHNMKNYGKNLLIKAQHRTQANLLMKFQSSAEEHIAYISPHRTFNSCRGVIYSRDLYDFSEEEILSLCPETVYKAKKLRGKNNCILLNFNCSFVPDFVDIMHTRLRVKKFYQRPTQCFNCFEYGHVVGKCRNTKKCSNCSGEHELLNECAKDSYCSLCGGGHCPNSRTCPRFRFEQEVLAVANNEFLSISSAKYKVMGANKSPNSTYASVVNMMKAEKASRYEHTSNSAHKSPPSNIPVDTKDKCLSKSSNKGVKTHAPIKTKPSERAHSLQDISTESLKGDNSKSHGHTKNQKVKAFPQSGTKPKKSRGDSDSEDNSVPSKKMRSHGKSNKCIPSDKQSETVEDMLDLSNSYSVLDSVECELELLKDCPSVSSLKPAKVGSTNEKDHSDFVEQSQRQKKNQTSQILVDSDKPSRPSHIPRIQRDSKNNASKQQQSSSKGHPAVPSAGKSK